MLHVIRVSGSSMSPTLRDGDFVVVLDRRVTRRYRVGDIVVVAHPTFGRIVKRVAARDDLGRISLVGDDPGSTSREALGWVSERTIVGHVCLRVPRRTNERELDRRHRFLWRSSSTNREKAVEAWRRSG